MENEWKNTVIVYFWINILKDILEISPYQTTDRIKKQKYSDSFSAAKETDFYRVNVKTM